MTDDQIALDFLTKMSASGFAGTRRDLRAHRDNKLSPARFDDALSRLEKTGEVTLEAVAKRQPLVTDADHVAWLDGQDPRHARDIAERNEQQSWAKAWLAKQAGPVNLDHLDPIEKAHAELEYAFAKARAEKETATLEFGAGLQVYAELLGKPANDILATEYMCTPAGSARYAKVCKADNAAAGIVDGNASLASLRAQLAEVMARMAARTEQYSLLWNWSPVDADKRLLSISADHKADMASALSIQNTISQLTATLAARAHVLATTSQSTPGTAYQTQPDLMPTPKRHVGPAMKKFNDELEGFAKSRKMSPEAATAAFLGTPNGNALYLNTEIERTER